MIPEIIILIKGWLGNLIEQIILFKMNAIWLKSNFLRSNRDLFRKIQCMIFDFKLLLLEVAKRDKRLKWKALCLVRAIHLMKLILLSMPHKIPILLNFLESLLKKVIVQVFYQTHRLSKIEPSNKRSYHWNLNQWRSLLMNNQDRKEIVWSFIQNNIKIVQAMRK